MAFLDVADLSVDFLSHGAATSALDGVNFELERSGALAVVGESGSGKSTLCLALLGLLPRQARLRAGRVHFDGQEWLPSGLKNLQAARGREISMIFQNPRAALNPYMRIDAQFFETLKRHRICQPSQMRRRCLEALAQTDLPEAALSAYPHQFSGGQCQRIMIAQALLTQPKLLIADEPTTALDLLTQARILDLLKRLRAEHGLALIIVSHDMRVVAQLADHVLVLKGGQLTDSGALSDLIQNPRHPYTKQLIDAVARDAPSHATTPDGANKTLMQVRDLNLSHRRNRRGRRLIVGRHLNFTVHETEIMGLVGESGCGKTSLARAIVGLMTPDSGEIIHRNDTRRPQLVFQNPGNSLNPRLTISEALGEILLRHRLARRNELKTRITALLEMVGLPGDWHHRFAHQLSGGQQQRVAIARALAAEPAMLVADEPTSALDVTLQEGILDLLCTLTREQRRSMILISHDMSVVRNRCDHVAIMKDAEIIEHADTKSLFETPRRDYTRRLLAAALPAPGAAHRSKSL